MKIFRSVCTLFFVFLLLLGACSCRRNEDFFDVFRGGFRAELSGSFESLAFSGTLLADPACFDDNGKPLPFAGTFTFYAPESLAGTVLTRTADGALSATCGSLTVPLGEDSGFAALFAVFPVSGDVSDVKLSDDGSTKVTGNGFSLSFLSTGEPISAASSTLTVHVIKFEKAENKIEPRV